MSEEEKKETKKDELDTETTIADMNVEGFSWYDPKKKKKENKPSVQLTKEEQKALIRGAYRAMLPLIGCIALSGLLMLILAYLWLK